MMGPIPLNADQWEACYNKWLSSLKADGQTEGELFRRIVEDELSAPQCQTEQRDLFALHAHIEDVKLAEDQLAEEIGAAGMLEADPVTIRIKARYAVADRMLRVRGEV